MKSISVFAGTAVKSSQRGVYSLSIYAEGKSFTLPAKVVDAPNGTRMTEYFLLLSALNDFLDSLISLGADPGKIVFFADSNEVRDDWDLFLKGLMPERGIKHIRLWEDAYGKTRRLNAELKIKGEGGMLSKLNSMQSDRLKGKRR